MSRLRPVLLRLRTLPAHARRVPLTTALLLVMVVAGVATACSGLSADQLLSGWGYGLPALEHGRWWTVGVGALILPDPALYVVMGPLVALAVGYHERRAGALRTGLVLLVTHLVGTVGAALLLSGASRFDWPWADLLARQTDLGASAGTVGVLAAATWLMPEALGRRIRWVGGGYVVVMVLRSGLLWDLEHLLGWFTGIAVGAVAVAGLRRGEYAAQRTPLARPPRIKLVRASLAWALVLLAVSKLITSVYRGNGGIFGQGVPGGAVDAGTVSTPGLVAGSLVLTAISLLVANALRRGLPVAWWAAVAIAALGLTKAGLMHGPRYTADLLLCGLLLAALVAARGYWPWRLPSGALWRTLPRMLVAIGGFLALSVLTLWIVRNQIDGTVRPHQLVGRALFEAHAVRAQTAGADALLTTVSVIWALALVAVALPLLYATHCPGVRRPGSLRDRLPRHPAAGADDTDEQRLRSLLERHGGGSLGWQRTWPGFTPWVSAAGDVGLGYSVVSGVAIVVGDPVGPWLRWRSAAAEFQRFCLRRGWTPAWYAVTERFLEVAGHEWRHTAVGEDAVIDLSALAFTGRSWQDVRTARNRAQREDIRCVRVDLATADAALLAGIDEVSHAWADGKPLPEMGFTLGTVDTARDGVMRTYAAVDAAGTVHGVTTWMPIHEAGTVVGWTLDVMRRRTDGFRPVMEFLIAECVLTFQQEGFDVASLSVAPLAKPQGAGDAAAEPDLLSKTLDRLGEMLEPAYGFRSLLTYKTKFHPRFETVHLAYYSQIDLAEIAVAIGRAYLPELSAGQALSIARALRPKRETEHRTGSGTGGADAAGAAAGREVSAAR